MLDLHNPYTMLLQDTSIVVPQPALVQDYLTRHPDMTDIVAQMGHGLQQEFGDTMQIALQLDSDPSEGYEGLTYYIRAEKYESNLDERLDEFDEPYGPALMNKSGNIYTMTDYQPPLLVHCDV